MANADIENNVDVTDKRRTQGNAAGNIATPANYSSVSLMRTRLAAISGLYTSARLDQMTKNDMKYAIRLNDDPTGI